MGRRLLPSTLVVFSLYAFAGAMPPPLSAQARTIGAPAPGGVPDGAPAALPMRPVIPVADHGYDAAVAYNSMRDEYLLVWGDPYRLYGTWISSRGDTAYPLGIASDFSKRASEPDVAYDPKRDRYLVVWARQNTSEDWDIEGAFLPSREWDVNYPGFTIEGGLEHYSMYPKVAYLPNQANGKGEFLVVWRNAESRTADPFIAGRRVSADGSAFPGPSFAIASVQSGDLGEPDVAANLATQEYLVTYDNDTDVFAQRLSAAGAPQGGPITVAGWPNSEFEPAVASCQNVPADAQYMVAWTSRQTVSGWLHARFIGSDGTPGRFTNRNPIDVPEGLDFACDIACRWKAQYMLAWSGDNGMRGSVIHADGTVDEPEEVSYGGGNGALAAGDPNLFFAWQAPSDKYPGYQDLFGRLVGQTKPRAVFSIYPESGNADTNFYFSASLSSDAEDLTDSLQVRWDWESDGVYDTDYTTTKTANHRFTSIGLHTIRLQVRDNYELTDTATGQVTTENTAPVAAFVIDPGIGDNHTVFGFDASSSSDPDGSPFDLEVRWDWTADGTYDTGWSTTKTATNSYPTSDWGTITVRMQVRDPGGLTNETTRDLRIDHRPIASFTIWPTDGDLCTTFRTDASGTSDPDLSSSHLFFRWNWEDDRGMSTEWSYDRTASHRYDRPGPHTIRLEVQQFSFGMIGTTRRSVNVDASCKVFLPSAGGP